MIYSSNFIAILDACVLYPAPVRDLLLSFADVGLYKPKWTSEIQDEWMRNLLLNRPDLSRQQLLSTVRAMDKAFPDANVERYKSFIKNLQLPDPKDRHVAAAAMRSNANAIVTYNIKDFPRSILDKLDIEVQHPDVFLTNIFDLNPDRARGSFKHLVKRLKNPPKSATEVIATIEKCHLKSIAEKLKDMR